jgi:hypothetical protein
MKTLTSSGEYNMLHHLKKMHSMVKAVNPEESQMIQEGMDQKMNEYLAAPRPGQSSGPVSARNASGKVGGSPEAQAALEGYFSQRQAGRAVGAVAPAKGDYASASGAARGRPVMVDKPQQEAPRPELDDAGVAAMRQKYGVGGKDPVSGEVAVSKPNAAVDQIKGELAEREAARQQEYAGHWTNKSAEQNPNPAMQHGDKDVSGNPPMSPKTPEATQRMHEVVQKAKGCVQAMGKAWKVAGEVPGSSSKAEADAVAKAKGYK